MCPGMFRLRTVLIAGGAEMRTETLVHMWQDYSGSLSSIQASLDHISARLTWMVLRLPE